MSVRRRSEWLVAAGVPCLFVMLAIWICYEALKVPVGSFRSPGAGFFPLGLGLSLAGLAVVLWIVSLSSPEAASEAGASEATDSFELHRVSKLALALVLAALAFERIGFVLTMVPFLAFTTHALGAVGWAKSSALAVVGCSIAYLAFARLLQIALPTGPLPF